jgi:tetraacyldisaccharide 4'-kinase
MREGEFKFEFKFEFRLKFKFKGNTTTRIISLCDQLRSHRDRQFDAACSPELTVRVTLIKRLLQRHTVRMFDQTKLLKIISGQRKGIVAGTVRFGLGCLTPCYRTAIRIRNNKFDRAKRENDQTVIKRATIPVISVGNLTTGGTGKTPLVIWIARFLRTRHLRVVLISRGYGSEKTDGNTGPNDEALEMEHRLPDVPHLQDPDRYRMSQIAVEELESQIIVLDDAFQHRQLHRDLDLVLIDATAPFGFDWLLPRGLLREPLSSLRRADAVILTRANLVSDRERQSIRARIRAETEDRPIAETRTIATGLLQSDGQRADLEKVNDQVVFCFCGIGNPDSFHRSLKQLQCKIVDSAVFPDHHHYCRADLQQIGQSANACGAVAIVCTHKDLVKVGTNQLAGIPVYAVLIEIDFMSGQTEIEQSLDRLADQASLSTDSK